MIELKNSKTTFLGETPDGRKKFAVDCYIGAIQMREPDGDWEDINPSIEQPDIDGFNLQVTKAPYWARIATDSRRRIYPDRTDLSYWIELRKPYASMGMPSRQDGWFYWNFTHARIGVKFCNTSVLFGFRLKDDQAPTSITIPFTVEGLEQHGRFFYRGGEVVGGFTRPVAADANPDIDETNVTSYLCMRLGEMILSLDTAGAVYPITAFCRLGRRIR